MRAYLNYFMDQYNAMPEWKKTCSTAATFSLASIITIFSRYRVATPSQVLVRTGLGINNISISKKAVQWPGQTATFMSLSPSTFEVGVSAMSKERIPFLMPTVWTIGPKHDNRSLEQYATLLMDKGAQGLEDTVKGVIQGEVRVLTADLALDVLFSDRQQFRINVEEKINYVIEDLGLKVYNSNVAELRDLDQQNKYFEEQKKRALEQVNQAARVAVAAADKAGTIGETGEVTESRKQVAALEKEATIVENRNTQYVRESNKTLAVTSAQFDQEIYIAQAQSKANAELAELQLQIKVEEIRQAQELEKQRAILFTSATVDAEVQAKKAEGFANSLKIEAEGQAQATMIEAEAKLNADLKKAEGIQAIKQAEAVGLESLIYAAGNSDSLSQYLLVEKEQLPKLIAAQAEGIKGLNPNISVWNTGPQDGDSVGKALTGFMQTSLPMFKMLKEQTGYDFLKSSGVSDDSSRNKSSVTINKPAI